MAQPDILVTGALGNVGAEVVKSLLAAGCPLRAGDIAPAAVSQRFGPGVEALLLDYDRPETFTSALSGIQRLFLMRPPQIGNVKKYLFPFLETARSAGVQQVVFLSILGVEQNQRVPHYQVEQHLRASGLSWTFLRCSFFMQNLSTTHRAEIRDRDELYVPVGEARTSFLDVRDIGAVAAQALTQPGHEHHAYDLTGPEALDYDQVAELLTHALGRKITYRNPSPLAFFTRQLGAKKSPMYALVTTWLYTNTKRGMAEQVTGEVARLLGREPIRMDQYIRDYRDCWMR